MHIKTKCWEKYPEKKPNFAKNCKGKQASRSSVATAAIDGSKGEIILAASNHGEQYVHLDHDLTSDDEESILEVITGQMHAVDMTNAYQYVPVNDDIKFLEQIESLVELKEEEYIRNMNAIAVGQAVVIPINLQSTRQCINHLQELPGMAFFPDDIVGAVGVTCRTGPATDFLELLAQLLCHPHLPVVVLQVNVGCSLPVLRRNRKKILNQIQEIIELLGSKLISAMA